MIHRAYAETRPAAVPLACDRIVGIATPLGARVACANDSALSRCSQVRPGRLYEGCSSSKALRGPILKLYSQPIDVSVAGVDDLRSLPGIGPALAERIVGARDKKPFCRTEDLLRVSGIGPKRVQALAGQVEFSDQACDETRPK